MNFTWAGLIFHICCLTTALCTSCRLEHYKTREKSNLSKDGGSEEVSSVCMFFLIILATNVNLSCTFVQKYLEEVGSHNQTCALGAFGRGSKG